MNPKNQKSNKLVLPLKEWPSADRKAWRAAQRKGTVFDKGGWAAEWSSHTAKNFCQRYGRWLQWLITYDPRTAGMLPAARVTPENIVKYLKHLHDAQLSEVTRHGYIRSLLTGMLGMAPQADWRWLNIVASNLRRVMKPSIDKRLQVRPIRDLYLLGVELMEDAERAEMMPKLKRAAQYRDGLIISIFASRAPRRGVVALMEIGTHLRLEGDRFWMVFGGNEMKGRRDSSKYLPKALTPYVNRYLDHHRRVLLRDPGGLSKLAGLWIKEGRRVMDGSSIYSAVCKRTFAKFGVSIPPHRFRDCLATSFAYEDPTNLPAATVVLDHTDPGMVGKHYNQAQAHVALQRIHGNLDELRKQLKPTYLRWRQEKDGKSDDNTVL